MEIHSKVRRCKAWRGERRNGQRHQQGAVIGSVQEEVAMGGNGVVLCAVG